MGAIEIINEKLAGRRDSKSAFALYKPLLLGLSEGKSVLEIGAGRAPLFSKAEISEHNIDYNANDISETELLAMLEPLPYFAFDASKSIPESLEGKFDLIFSKMVQEHVSGTVEFYKNIARMLKPGGIVLNFHPVLYAFPFIVNRLLPEGLSDPLLYAIRKDRTRDRSPKFPALYDQCVISRAVRERLSSQGFSEIHQLPFYGHGYYRAFPIVRDVHDKFTRYAQKNDLTALATFSYTVGVK